YNIPMIKECHGTTIRKKTYMGDRKLVKAIVDPSCEIIEDWAFANCCCLKEVWMPYTIREVSEKAFLNCAAMEQLYLYDTGNTTFSLAKTTADPVLLATVLKCYPKETNLLIQHAKTESVFLQYTDSRLENFLEEDDSSGFVPFLAGGEEDYIVDDAAAAFQKKRQFLKTQLIYERLLAETRGYTLAEKIKQTCIHWLQSHNPSAAFVFLLTDTIRRDSYLDLYFILELNTDVNIDVLTALADNMPELKAKLLQKHLENRPQGNTLLSALEI
ncbi:MAG: leucine-rich repeat protein, partial [Lachnospiraceae bacterium]|nr:leucine-rich repeat protein [Lachnospiraceae bacterium]